MKDLTLEKFFKEIGEKTQCEIRTDSATKVVYSVDASIFEIEPLGILLPKTREDLITIAKIAHSYKIPLIPRGAATGITGGCLGKGVVIDVSKYLSHILEINLDEHYVICEPGVIQDQLNAALVSHGFRLGPDTSTGNRATIGGMVANHAAGAHSLCYGTMIDAVLSVELILSTGEQLFLEELSKTQVFEKSLENTSEGIIYREITRILQDNQDEIKRRFPKIPRHVSGYPLDRLQEPLNLAKLLVGSEGTLGILSKIKLKIVPIISSSYAYMIPFDSFQKAFEAVPKILKYSPLSLEMIDEQILTIGSQTPAMKGNLDWLNKIPSCILVVECKDKTNDIENAWQSLSDPEKIVQLKELRKAGLGILMSKRSYTRAIAFLEDISVGPEKLAPFMNQFCTYLKQLGLTAGIYGHAGAGCMHVRPFVNLRKKEELLIKKMMLHVSDLLLEYQGSLSGEHGDGLIRSWLNEKMFGSQIYNAFIQVKYAFDPDQLMNPEKIVNGTYPFHDLRSLPAYEPKTFLDFSKEGGFSLAVDLCNGNGQCRKKEGVMCPSFQATQDEYDTTRARAQSLRALINGKLLTQDVKEVLDLCLSCKGCKKECPSQVDMAKMKAEFTYTYQKKYGIPFRSWLIGSLGKFQAIASPFASFFNFCSTTSFFKWLFEKIGFSSYRTFPALANQTFSEWFKKQNFPTYSKQVVLFNDTYTQFNCPEVGQSADQILNALGYNVIVPPWTCCGRPAISKGLLPQAQKAAQKVFSTLIPYAKQGIPIIGLEPSCILTFLDEYPALLPKEDIQPLFSVCKTLDQFLEEHLQEGVLPLQLNNCQKTVYVHGHCHQKALIGMSSLMKTLKGIPGIQVREISSGCCGMAGSFGYEKEHYDLSMKIGELALFPVVRKIKNEELLVANGISCRTQIRDGTNKKALHLAELISSLLEN